MNWKEMKLSLWRERQRKNEAELAVKVSDQFRERYPGLTDLGPKRGDEKKGQR